jgi:soluble P-type ATPase
LAEDLTIHVLTADTFGNARAELEGVPCAVSILPSDDQDRGKLAYVQQLGPEFTVCIGNGRNDRLMLKEAVLGIAVVLVEGAAVEACRAADVVCTTISSALDLLRNPLRLVATLRS